MILILSTPKDDDTNWVMEHLSILGEKYIRINDLDLFTGKTKMYVELQPHPKLIVENHFFGKVDMSEIKCVWFRKFGFFNRYKENIKTEKNIELLNYLESEYISTLNIFFEFLKDKKWLNHYQNLESMTKIGTLMAAHEIGIKIPKTYITNNSDNLNYDQPYITKSINEGSVIGIDDKAFFFFTTQLSEKRIKTYKNFFPSLFQEMINKEYELRIFHLNGKNYSMAIFSQNDAQTKTDYRQVNYESPNRYVSYNLPDSVDKKISALMKKIGLNTGSVDMIKADDGEYYFLEVNPSGQFRMTSLPCNYNLHYEVAHCLKTMNT